MHKYTAYFRKVWLGTFPPVAISWYTGANFNCMNNIILSKCYPSCHLLNHQNCSCSLSQSPVRDFVYIYISFSYRFLFSSSSSSCSWFHFLIIFPVAGSHFLSWTTLALPMNTYIKITLV
jgi:hypothetical protein